MTVKGASVIVIGGGVTGLSTAWWLARSGVDVLVLEGGMIGWGASGRNGGIAIHYASPLFAEEQRLWPQMNELLGYPTEWFPQHVAIAMKLEDYTRLHRIAAIGAAHGFTSTELDPKQLREIVPLVSENVLGGMQFHFGGQANPHRTVQGYAWAARDLGATIMPHITVLGFEQVGGRVTGVKTTAGDFSCDTVVIAAGPGTSKLANLLGVELPTALARVEMIVTEPLELMPLRGIDGNGLYGRQTMRGNLAYGGGPHSWLSDDGPHDVMMSTQLIQSMAKRLTELLPGARHARMIRSWAGILEITPDGRPVLDRMTSPDNVVLATMSGVGFGLSPAVGHAVAEIAMNGECGFADLGTCKLERFESLERDWRTKKGWVPDIHGELTEAH